jgi:general secretion pathway protein E
MDMSSNSLAPDARAVERLPYAFAKRHGVISARALDEGFELWVRPGVRAGVLAEVQRALGRPLSVRELAPEAFDAALARAYERGASHAAEIVTDLDSSPDLAVLAENLPRIADLLESEDDAPIVRLINALFSQAVRENASDIHIEAFERRSVVRFRRDGMLRDVLEPPQAAHGVIVSRIKIMARLDIAEKRQPQDGRIALRLGGRSVDVRVSILPTAHGERVVLRLLDKQAGRLDLTGLGMADTTLATLRDLIRQPHGIILVTGPTGSGKTTTLYAVLGQLDAKHTNIVTVEDPIEYDLDGVGQTQVNPRIDLTFARALRAILRQDPDVVMIGEIRDLETAQIAVQASLTGHLVLATLHTNDAAGAVVRLVDMGIEPFLVASSLLGVLAQRLVRRLCPACRRGHAPDAAERTLLANGNGGDAIGELQTANGCEACAFTGYQGRTGIFELLLVDDESRRLIHERASEADLREHARRGGMKGLREDGMRWVRSGDTSLEEVLRVSRE